MFDVVELMQRMARGKRYPLPFLLTVMSLAKLAREDTPKGIAGWLKLKRRQVVAAFNLKRPSVPACNTIRRILAETLSAEEHQQSFLHFLHENYGTQTALLKLSISPSSL